MSPSPREEPVLSPPGPAPAREGGEGRPGVSLGQFPGVSTHTMKTCIGPFTQTLPGELCSWEGISERGFKGNEQGEQH